MGLVKFISGIGAVTIALLIGTAQTTHATGIYTLADGNSEAVFDITNGAGHFDWLIDDADIMERQWFYYRIGSTGPESPINAISDPTVVIRNTNRDLRDDNLIITYANSQLQVAVDYLLRGGQAGSHTATLAEVITIKNLGSQSITLHFFQYVDFKLGNPEEVAILGTPRNTAEQAGQAGKVSEVVVTPPPTRYQAGVGSTILDSLQDGQPTTLNNNDVALGSDVNWAFQWTATLSPGQQYTISKIKTAVVPEPATLILLMAGSATMLFGTRRRKR